MLNELSTILISVISTMAGTGGVFSIFYYRQNKKLKDLDVKLKDAELSKAKIDAKADEWHLYKEQLDTANNRIVELLKINSEKDKDKNEQISLIEDRFTKQTDVLRKAQRDLNAALEKTVELTLQNGKMQRMIDHLTQWMCRRPWKECKRREPEQKIKIERYIPLDEMVEELTPQITCNEDTD